MLLESGYMKALGKKLIVASRPEGRAILLKALADDVFEFSSMGEFKDKLKKII
jgi:NADPH:quinone reductase-like Zn-dependent oxidoreductase